MAENKLDYFKLMRDFWDFAFENPELIKPNHCALYGFTVEHCNRLGWKVKFGLPASMVLDAIGLKSYSVYKKTFDDLVDFGFIEVIEYSRNQHSSNVVALKENSKANYKAYSKAHSKARNKANETTIESTLQSTLQSTVSIIKPITSYLLPIKTLEKEEIKIPISKNEFYGKELLEGQIWIETIAMQNKISKEEIPEWIEIFNKKLISEEDVKISRKEYASHFSRWLPSEILKHKKSDTNGKPQATRNR
jgi:hypothetical protein